jgi:hypothetical protein
VPFALPYTLLQVSDFDAAELARIDLAGITSHDAAVERIQRHSMGWSWTHERAFAEHGVACRTLIPASDLVRRLASPAGADEGGAGADHGARLTYVDQAIREARPDVVFLENPAFLDQQAIATIHRNRRQSALVGVQATAEQARQLKANTLAAVAGLLPSMPGSL